MDTDISAGGTEPTSTTDVDLATTSVSGSKDSFCTDPNDLTSLPDEMTSTSSCSEALDIPNNLREEVNDAYSSSSSSSSSSCVVPSSNEEVVPLLTSGGIPTVVVNPPDEEDGEQSPEKMRRDEEGEKERGGDEDENEEPLAQHPLIPIKENEVTDFLVEEVCPVIPLTYPVITDKLTTGADESFLYLSESSLAPENKDGRSNTMNNLHERASFLNLTKESSLGKNLQKALLFLKDDITFGSMVALNKAAVKENDDNKLIDDEKHIPVVVSGKYMKNLLAMCCTITLVFIALGSVRNLQSSINHEGGIGVICLGISFTGYTIGGLLSSILVQNISPRRCLIAGIIPHIIYTAANIYPAAWLLAPSAFAQGWALAVIWNTMSTYITLLAKGKSQQSKQEYTAVSGRFFGIFGLLYQSYFIIGNLIAALILQLATSGGDDSSSADGLIAAFNQSDPSAMMNNASTFGSSVVSTLNPTTTSGSHSNAPAHLHICGAKYWQHYDLGGDDFSVTDETKYLLFGVYIGITVLAMLIAIFVLEDLNPKLFESSVPVGEKIRSQLWNLLIFFKDVRLILIFPLLMYSYMQVGFVTAEILKAFVTCPLGIYMVGYTMVCLGIFGSLSSYISGLCTHCVGRLPQILLGEPPLLLTTK